jgi:hypothetical protein
MGSGILHTLSYVRGVCLLGACASDAVAIGFFSVINNIGTIITLSYVRGVCLLGACASDAVTIGIFFICYK